VGRSPALLKIRVSLIRLRPWPPPASWSFRGLSSAGVPAVSRV